jgi:filamentous hemagglutinin
MSLDTNVIQQYYAGILRLTPSAATINAYAQLPSYEAAMDAMMNAAVSSVNPITKLYQAAFDRVPDSAGLTNYTAAYGAGAGTMTLQQIANQWTGTIEFTTDYPASMPNADYVGLLYWNVLHRAADPVGAANFTAALNSGKMTRADVLLELSQSPEFAFRIDGHIRGFQEQCALNDPLAYTGTLWDKTPPGPGETITLTTNIDTVNILGSGADTVVGTIQSNAAGDDLSTLNTGDTVNGNGKTVMSLIVNDVGDADIAPIADINNLAAINVNLALNAAAGSALNMVEFDNVARVAITQGSTNQELDITNAQFDTTYAIDLARAVAVDIVSFEDDTGAADTVSLAFNGAGTSATARAVIDLSDEAVESVNIATSGTSFASVNNGSAVETYTITGAGTTDLVIDDAAATMTIDASGNSGTNTLRIGSLLTSLDTIIGGSGADTLRAIANVGTTRATISAVETLRFDFDNAGATQDLRNATGVTTLTLEGDETATVTRAASTIANVNLVSTTSTGADDVNVTYTTGSDTATTLTIGTTNAAGTAAVSTGTVTIAGNAGALTVSSTGDAANAAEDIVADDVASLTVSTVQDLAVTGGGGDDISAASATSATFTTAGGDLTVDDDVILTDATAVDFNALNGAITVTGDVAGAAENVVINFTANGGNANDIRVAGQITSENFDAINVAAAAAADVTIVDILVGTDTADTTTHEINLEALGTGTIVTVADVNAEATGDVLDLVTVTTDADGEVSFTVAAGETDLVISEIDATASAGTLTVDLGGANLAGATGVDMSTGAGDTLAILTADADTFVGGTGADEVWGMGGADDITLGGGHDIVGFTTNVTADVVGDFVAGATTVASSDVAEFDLSAFNALVGAMQLGDGSGMVVADGLVRAVTAAAGSGNISASAANVYALTGTTYANLAAVDAAIITGGTRPLIVDDAVVATDGLIFAWEDNSGNTHLSLVVVDTATDTGTTSTVDAVTVTDIAQLVGVQVGSLVSANFAIVA